MNETTQEAADAAGKGVEWLARFGYAAKGVVYAIVGVLAAMVAFGMGGQTTGTKGAVSQIGSETHGQVMLLAVAVGLFGYVVWRFAQAIKDPEHEGTGFKGLIKRASFFVSGLIYGSLAIYTISLLLGAGGGGGGNSKESMTARLMSYEGGVWAVGIIGALIVLMGVMQFVRAFKEKYKQKWSLASMGATQTRWASRIAKWGLSARGLVFFIIGGFVIVAALQTDPSKATGLNGALDTLAQQSFGLVLLGVVGLGLLCYGIYCWVNALYRRINP